MEWEYKYNHFKVEFNLNNSSMGLCGWYTCSYMKTNIIKIIKLIVYKLVVRGVNYNQQTEILSGAILIDRNHFARLKLFW